MTRLRRLFRTRQFRRAALFLTVTSGAYLLIMFPLGCGKALADRLMLFPSTAPLEAFGAAERFVETHVGRMQIWVARGGWEGEPEPETFVLRLEGNGGRAEFSAVPVAERWGERPTEVWAMNHPGFGGSEGPAALDRLIPAALAVLDALVAEARGRPVFIDADSMGSAIGLYLAAERPEAVRGLILKNPPPLRQLVMGRFGWWNLWLAAWPVSLAVPAEMDAISNARRCRMPVVVISARLDSLVPVAYQNRIVEALAGPLQRVWFDGAEHNTPIDEATDRRIVAAVAWLRSQASAASDGGGVAEGG